MPWRTIFWSFQQRKLLQIFYIKSKTCNIVALTYILLDQSLICHVTLAFSQFATKLLSLSPQNSAICYYPKRYQKADSRTDYTKLRKTVIPGFYPNITHCPRENVKNRNRTGHDRTKPHFRISGRDRTAEIRVGTSFPKIGVGASFPKNDVSKNQDGTAEISVKISFPKNDFSKNRGRDTRCHFPESVC